MAVASGLTTTFALETLIQSSPAPAAASSSPASFIKVLGRRPSRRFRNGTLIQRRSTPVMIPRCEVGVNLAVTSADSARAASLSALELLKTSAADRMSILSLSLYSLFMRIVVWFCGGLHLELKLDCTMLTL